MFVQYFGLTASKLQNFKTLKPPTGLYGFKYCNNIYQYLFVKGGFMIYKIPHFWCYAHIINALVASVAWVHQIWGIFLHICNSCITQYKNIPSIIWIVLAYMVFPRRRLPHKKCTYFPQHWWLRDLLVILFCIRTI